jgi:head-tail adaptor
MPAAGPYNIRLRWLTLNRTDDETGDGVDTHLPSTIGYLWAYVIETNGRRQEEGGAEQSGVDVEVHVRNYPQVSTDDLLQDEYNGYVYHLDSIRNGDDELIIDAFRDHRLINFNIEETS